MRCRSFHREASPGKHDGLDRIAYPQRRRLEGGVAADAPGITHGGRADPCAAPGARGLGSRCDGARLLRHRRRLHRQRPGDCPHPAADDRRRGPLDGVLDERGDRARAHARRNRAFRPARALLRGAGGRRAVRSGLRGLPRQLARGDAAGAARPRHALQPARAASDRRDGRWCGRRHRGRACRLRGVGDRRAAPGGGGCFHRVALVPRGVVAVCGLLVREPPAGSPASRATCSARTSSTRRAGTSATC